MSEATISLKKAILVVVVTCILSSVSTWGVINATPSLVLTQISENQAKIIRLRELNEINVTGGEAWVSQDVATFVWTPNNPENNVILAVYCYFDYRSENPEQFVWEWEDPTFWWELHFNIKVNDFTTKGDKIRRSGSNQQEWERKHSTDWEQVSFLAQPISGLWINPNQDNYTLTFRTLHMDRASSTTPTYVRNINVIIEVIDGI